MLQVKCIHNSISQVNYGKVYGELQGNCFDFIKDGELVFNYISLHSLRVRVLLSLRVS